MFWGDSCKNYRIKGNKLIKEFCIRNKNKISKNKCYKIIKLFHI
jgi:hypothetical protein